MSSLIVLGILDNCHFHVHNVIAKVCAFTYPYMKIYPSIYCFWRLSNEINTIHSCHNLNFSTVLKTTWVWVWVWGCGGWGRNICRFKWLLWLWEVRFPCCRCLQCPVTTHILWLLHTEYTVLYTYCNFPPPPKKIYIYDISEFACKRYSSALKMLLQITVTASSTFDHVLKNLCFRIQLYTRITFLWFHG